MMATAFHSFYQNFSAYNIDKRDFINTEFLDHYLYLNIVNRGSYGVVHRVQHKETGEILAVKEEFQGLCKSTMREIGILRSLPSHPSIVKFKEVVANNSGRVFVAMEYLQTDLNRYMNDRKQPFNLCEVKLIMKQVLEGLDFLHDRGIAHRDLKPSNILINTKSGQSKICDFGLSRKIKGRESGSYTPGVVTLWYRAPELFFGVKNYSSAIDMWSMGCIMAELVLKEVLFEGKTELDQLCCIYDILGRDGKGWNGSSSYNMLWYKFFRASAFSGAPMLTENGLDLLQRLLVYDPQKRITAKEALNHPWFREYYGFSS